MSAKKPWYSTEMTTKDYHIHLFPEDEGVVLQVIDPTNDSEVLGILLDRPHMDLLILKIGESHFASQK